MPRMPLPFVRCVACGHVYNRDFHYSIVPYAEKPNRMYNRAAIWGDHLRQVRNAILHRLPDQPTVVEVGCGQAHFLRGLAESRPAGRYIGFDPNGSAEATGESFEVRKILFDPVVHLDELRPHMIVSRHVLEHLMNPLGFLQRLAFASAWLRLETLLLIEVPCIDRAFQSGRVADFYYEHNSHFTTASFTRMLRSCATELDMVEHGYNGEVIFGVARMGLRPEQVALAGEALDFRRRAVDARSTIGSQLAELHAAGKSVAIWGGTGKGAAFVNYFGVDARRFPLVVDSDPDKVGTFVPGMGQRIRSIDAVRDSPVDAIIIPTQWRAADIVEEMARCGIQAATVLIEHHGRLIDFHRDQHPYRFKGARR